MIDRRFTHSPFLIPHSPFNVNRSIERSQVMLLGDLKSRVFNSIMKRLFSGKPSMQLKVLLTSLVSLTVLGTGLCAGIESAIAQPAPVFRPLVDDIRRQLPKGLKMRLPASMPNSPIQLYPFIQSDDKVFRIHIGIKPDCSTSANSSSCTVGVLAVFLPNNSRNWPPQGKEISSVNLIGGIRGYYLASSGGKSIFWEQEGLRYAVAVATNVVSQQQLLDLVNSMVSQPAIASMK
jgi:hypothetical protein